MHDTFFMLVYIVLGSLIYPIQSANAKEVWMEMDVQDGGVPGRYEWAEVSCGLLAVDYWMVYSNSCLRVKLMCIFEELSGRSSIL